MRFVQVDALALVTGLACCAIACSNASSGSGDAFGGGSGSGSGSGAAASAGAAAVGSGTAAVGSGTAGSRATGSGGKVSNTGAAGASGSGAAGSQAGAVTFKQIYAIFAQSCAGGGCHVSSAGAAGLSMGSQATAYTSLVGASSSKCRNNQRVVPGNPDSSVLVHALEHTTFSGCRPPAMPQGKPMLSQTDLTSIRAWITAGALNN